jgi:hypothetical protein
MFHGKKTAVMIPTDRDYNRELKALYARRSVLDHLIASLEAYDRYRSTKATATSAVAGRARRSA